MRARRLGDGHRRGSTAALLLSVPSQHRAAKVGAGSPSGGEKAGHPWGAVLSASTWVSKHRWKHPHVPRGPALCVSPVRTVVLPKNPNPRPGSPAHPRAHRELWSYLQLPTLRGLRGSSRITAPGPGTIISQGQRRISALQRARPSTPPVKIIPWCCSQGSAAVTGLTHTQPRRIFRLKWQLMLEQSRAVTTTRCATGSGDGAGSDTHPWGGGWGCFYGVRSTGGPRDAAGPERSHCTATAGPPAARHGGGGAAITELHRGHRRATAGPPPSCTRATTEPYWDHHQAILGPPPSHPGASAELHRGHLQAPAWPPPSRSGATTRATSAPRRNHPGKGVRVPPSPLPSPYLQV